MMRKKINSYEMDAILYLGLLDGRLKLDGETLEKRLRAIPDAWRQYRIAQTAMDKTIGYLYDSVPQSQLRHLRTTIQNSTVQIKPRGVTPPPQSMIIGEDILRLLVTETMVANCALCLADPNEVRKCRIRKALTTITPPDTYPKGNTCPYREITLHNDLGDYCHD